MSGPLGLVLAAGAGTRMGGPKAGLVIAGRRLVDRAVAILQSGGCADVVVVTGDEDLRVRAAAEVVVNADAASGMGSSLRCGLAAALRRDATMVVVLLVDQPLIAPEAVACVIAAASGPDALVQASYDGRRGHPVLIGSDHFSGVMGAAVGDQGARGYLEGRLAERSLTVLEVPGDPADVDTPADRTAIEIILGG